MRTTKFIAAFCVIAFLLCLCRAFIAFGQSKAILVPTHTVDALKLMNVAYNKPIGFEEVPGTECFKSWPKLEEIITCSSRQLRSEDGQFLAFTSMYRTLNKEDSIFISKISPNGFIGTEWIHEASIKHHIELSWGEKAAENLKKYVEYYPAGKARRKFNADSAMFYSVKLEPEDYYQNKYNHFDILCLAKKRRGVVFFYCFYTDEGKKKFNKYWKAVERTIRFLD